MLLRPHVSDQHNVPVRNYVSAIHQGSIHAIQIHPGNGGWLLLRAMQRHHPADR